MKWIIAILIFSLLILFHEFGHFLMARLNGVAVEEFSLGFGPRLLSAKRGETRYSLKLLLFGGSCRMRGMLGGTEDEDGNLSPEPGSFQAASARQRAAIIFGGPFFNFLLAWICAVVVLAVVGYDPAVVTSVEDGSAAQQAGLKAGDTITSFMGRRVEIGRDVDTWFVFHDLSGGQNVTLTFKRDGQTHTVSYTPDVQRRYMLGLTYSVDGDRAEIQSVSVGSPLDKAGVRAGDVITAVDGTKITTAKSLYRYFQDHPLGQSSVKLTLSRGGRFWETDVKPLKRDDVRIGFGYNLGRTKTTAPQVIRLSFVELRYWIGTTLESIGALFTGRFGINDLSGPVGIVDVVGTTYEESRSDGALMTWMNMINLIILLSANLGVMNLLPIPALDGGRLLFLLIEAIRGKPVNPAVEASVETVVAVLLMLLMVYVMYHDVLTFVSP